MVKPRTQKELRLMRESGRITALVLKKVLENIKVGISGLELNQIAEKEIKSLGGEVSFKTVRGYNFALCITFNEQIVHGIPTERKIEEGDVVSVDLGAVYKGWHTDAAWTVLVGEQEDKIKFLKIGEQALWTGISQAIEGNKIGDISFAIQQIVETAGYSIVRSFVGHGIGQKLHEDPQIPGYGKQNTGLILQSGMTLAVEVIYTKGLTEVVLEDDGWTISAADGLLSALFEMTVVVGKSKAEILTDLRHIP